MLDKKKFAKGAQFRFRLPGHSADDQIVEVYGYTSAKVRVATPEGRGLLVSPRYLEELK